MPLRDATGVAAILPGVVYCKFHQNRVRNACVINILINFQQQHLPTVKQPGAVAAKENCIVPVFFDCACHAVCVLGNFGTRAENVHRKVRRFPIRKGVRSLSTALRVRVSIIALWYHRVFNEVVHDLTP